jgi:hypothetical protein
MRSEFHIPGQCLLCDEFAGKIYQKHLEDASSVLPLNPELSEQIYSEWDRGEPTPFYEKLSQL